MSRRTRQKLQRQFFETHRGLIKRPEVIPAQPREAIQLDFMGRTYTEYVAKGQILNPKKVYKRFLAATKYTNHANEETKLPGR